MRQPLALGVALPLLLAGLACSPRPSATAGDGGGNTPAAEADGAGEATTGTGAAIGSGGEAVDDERAGAEEDAMSSRAVAENIQIMVKKSFPVQVSATVEGYLPDPCTEIVEATAELAGSTFRIALPTHRDPEVLCAQVIQPFTRTVELDVHGLAAGEYEVVAGEARATFTLDRDNRLDRSPR